MGRYTHVPPWLLALLVDVSPIKEKSIRIVKYSLNTYQVQGTG